ARLLGATVLGMMMGSWAGGAVTQAFGWRAAFFVVAALFAVPAAVLSLGHLRAQQADHAPTRHGYFRQVATVLGSPWARRVLAVAFIEGALVFGALAFVPSTLNERFQLTFSEACVVLALFGVGVIAYS